MAMTNCFIWFSSMAFTESETSRGRVLLITAKLVSAKAWYRVGFRDRNQPPYLMVGPFVTLNERSTFLRVVSREEIRLARLVSLSRILGKQGEQVADQLPPLTSLDW